MNTPRIAPDEWLSAALTGGLPEPSLSRWQPLRVGIVNLWEYDNAEFWFADGRLVLRGGNGAGKTKVLELTTLMLLRGEITASTLDPFGSQHRTMRFNLLPTGEEDDPRPLIDTGLGYAWAEFGRRPEDGAPEYFVCGLGASAKRGTGTSSVSTWQLITHLRPGKDLDLCPVGRPRDMKELKKLDGVAVLESATRYRAKLAAELFGLGDDAYDNLTELLKQLRKPKLGERLNPNSLAETLREALPPLAGNEITQLAEGWERLERLREAVDETKEAAVGVATFVRQAWLPWVRVVVRRRADACTSATTRLDDTTRQRNSAESELNRAHAKVTRTGNELTGAKRTHTLLSTELRELLETPAFQNAQAATQRVRGLTEKLTGLRGQRNMATELAQDFQAAAEKAAETVTEAEADVTDGQEAVDSSWYDALRNSEPAGLADSVRRHRPAAELPALHADFGVREQRFTQLCSLHQTFGNSQKKVSESAQLVRHRTDAVTTATQETSASHEQLNSRIEELRASIREWAAGTTVLDHTPEQVETWCDLVAELTVADSTASTPSAAVSKQVTATGDVLRTKESELRAALVPLREERRKLTTELDRLADQVEEPPPPPVLWQRRARPQPDDAAGAPLWRCVRPVVGLADDQLDTLEATMAAAGLLDAWLTPTGELTAADEEVQLPVPATKPDSALTAVLVPEPAGGVPAEVIRSVLSGIAWHPTRHGTEHHNAWLAADGTWRIGPLTGHAAACQPASYLGATAREAARQRVIRQLTNRLNELKTAISAAEEEEAQITRQLAVLAAEADRFPADRPVTDQAARWWEHQRLLERQKDLLDKAETTHRHNESERDAALAEFTQYAGQHAFPTHNLDGIRSALGLYRTALGRLESTIALLAVHQKALAKARSNLGEQQRQLSRAVEEMTRLTGDVEQAEAQLKAATTSLGADHQALLDTRAELDKRIDAEYQRIEDLNNALREAEVAANTASNTLDGYQETWRKAELTRDAALIAWWEAFDAGVAQSAGLNEPERRNVTTAKELATVARREITTTGDEQAQDRSWRRCYQQLQDLRQRLLPNRDARVIDELDGGTIQQVVVLADSTAGWQSPDQAADALAEQVRKQEDTFDEEQQRVLTTLLGSAFIEHLKDRLDYTEHTFTSINARLAEHPTRHGHAIRLAWSADPRDHDAQSVVTALSQGYQQLSTPRQDMVRAFLARKIDAARADATAEGSKDWKEQLSSALDYRGWLKITLQYRAGSTSNWAPFDSARHGAKSGGEKVVLLSQPLFAAAVVAYDAAAATAPRWVWLDEAMTGVDDEIKASFMGLTVSFDLDVMLTAHDEWCKYSTVPAAAVYDLARQKGLPGVDAMPYLWCGSTWTAFEPVVDRSSQLAEEGLFAGMEVD